MSLLKQEMEDRFHWIGLIIMTAYITRIPAPDPQSFCCLASRELARNPTFFIWFSKAKLWDTGTISFTCYFYFISTAQIKILSGKLWLFMVCEGSHRDREGGRMFSILSFVLLLSKEPDICQAGIHLHADNSLQSPPSQLQLFSKLFPWWWGQAGPGMIGI